jgi:MFS family permease
VAGPDSVRDKEHDPYGALRHVDYQRLLIGTVLASAGNEMQAVALGWELYERTSSAKALGLVGLAQFIPFLLLSLPGGHAADRYSRKKVLVTAQSLLALVSLGLAAFSFFEGPVPLAYLCMALIGAGGAFASPARWSLVPQVVPAGVLGNAITWNSSGWQIASMIGPAAGGVLIAATGHAVGAYVLAACCSLACAALVLPIRPTAQERTHEEVSLASLLAGIRYVLRTKVILATITLDLFAVLLGGATALLPIFAKDILDVGPNGLGWLRAAPSLGALLMAVVIAHRPPMRRAGPAMLWAVAGFGVATIVFGLSQNFVLSFVMLLLTGALDNISVVIRGTLVQVLPPDAMRGRVSAVNLVFIGSSNELGAFESGITAYWFGAVPSVIGGGIGTILVVLIVMAAWPQVLRLGSLAKPLEGAVPSGTSTAEPAEMLWRETTLHEEAPPVTREWRDPA